MASIMEGPLSKWTNVMKGWQYRWFVLDYNAGLLSYYTSKDKMMRGSRRGCVRLRGAVIGIDDEDDSTFTITVDQKTFHFQARDADEREKWIHALEETILRHTLQLQKVKVKVTQLCQTLCDSMDCMIHGILQARILEPVEKKDMISIRIWLRGIVRAGINLTRNAIESVKWYAEVARCLGLLQQRKIPLRNVPNIVAVTEGRGISGS